jgi:cobaltochelatase CobN
VINVVQKRAHLSFCFTGCCCGRTDRGFLPAPAEIFKEEWLRRKIRNVVHLTKGGCLGPCALANVASLVFDTHSIWFHSVSEAWQVRAIYDYIEAMLQADRYLPPPPELAAFTFNYYDWDARPRTPLAEAPSVAVNPNLIAFLTHADTDLLALGGARSLLPEGLDVMGLSLLSIRDEETMRALLAGRLQEAAAIVLRLHGSTETVPGFELLRQAARQRAQRMALVSGTGEMDPQLARVSDVPLDTLTGLTTYFQQGGPGNLADAFRFLSDRILMTGHGYNDPLEMPLHGIYLGDIDNATIEDWQRRADAAKPTAAILFYRAHLLSGNTTFVDRLCDALLARGFNTLPIYTASLKDQTDGIPTALAIAEGHADVLISTLSFAHGEPNQGSAAARESAFARLNVPVLQAITSGMPEVIWRLSARGLNPLDTAINVALPEFDGRLITVPISFKDRHPDHQASCYVPVDNRVDRVAGMAARWVRLQRLPNAEKRVAFVLTNSSSKASQVGNAVGLDAPASLLNLLRGMRTRGYTVHDLPESSDDLMHAILARGCYDDEHPLQESLCERYPAEAYDRWYCGLPEVIQEKLRLSWGRPGEGRARGWRHVGQGAVAELWTEQASPERSEPWRDRHGYQFASLRFGNALIALQPPRGYGMNPDAIYHTPDLPPTHHYCAFYRWLATPTDQGGWGADAIVHVGKHGTLEWLPGKGVGLSAECFPDLLLEDLPLLYPFIINDPGEGSQAKRRGHAVIIDHMPPLMTIAETYGPLAQLNELVNEYYSTEKLDPTKLPIVQRQIWDLVEQTNLKADLNLSQRLSEDHGDHKHAWDDQKTPEGVPTTLSRMSGNEVAHLIEDIDGYLCELGLAQIRNGLHTLGEMPNLPEMLCALTRLPNAAAPSLQESIAAALGHSWNQLWNDPGKRLPEPIDIQGRTCNANADILETIESLALSLYQRLECDGFSETAIPIAQQEVLGFKAENVARALRYACTELVSHLECVDAEIWQLLHALEGRYIEPGPSGAPTRGNAHILPTGRNFYAVDPRAVPSPTAWQVGQQLAREAIERYRKEEGVFPESIGLTLWGTSQMRTQGDDVAEALALLGVQPVWDPHSRRIGGLEAIPLDKLGRPRVDVTMRISGFFRDAFPHLIELLDDAVDLVVHLDEPGEQNFPRKHYLADLAADLPEDEAEEKARYRIFGSKPGSYGAGLLPLIEAGNWKTTEDLAKVFLAWGGYAYGRRAAGVEAQDTFRHRLRTVQIALHNQDNREHDIFDSDDYFQFHGGMVASIRALTGVQPKAYFGDSSRPEASRVRSLQEEALRVYRSRVVNPKWMESIRKHGYKGGLELAATVDYIFGFDATAEVVPDFVYEGLAEHYALDPAMQDFLRKSNPWALNAIGRRLLEAADRGMWEAPSDAAISSLRNLLDENTDFLEAREEGVAGKT